MQVWLHAQVRWLRCLSWHCPQEKYTPDNYKAAKALKNKLLRYKIFQQRCDYFGEERDFLSPGMAKPDVPIRNMNSFGSCLDMFVGTYPAHEIGYVLMEICKMCAGYSEQFMLHCCIILRIRALAKFLCACPLLIAWRTCDVRVCVCVCVCVFDVMSFCGCASEVPLLQADQDDDSTNSAADADAGSSVQMAPVTTGSGGVNAMAMDLNLRPMFVFVKGCDSQQTIQAQEKLTCNVAGSIFVKKIAASASKEKDNSDQAKKRKARAPELAGAEAKGAAKSKAKAKAKSKSNANTKAAASSTAGNQEAPMLSCPAQEGNDSASGWMTCFAQRGGLQTWTAAPSPLTSTAPRPRQSQWQEPSTRPFTLHSSAASRRTGSI